MAATRIVFLIVIGNYGGCDPTPYMGNSLECDEGAFGWSGKEVILDGILLPCFRDSAILIPSIAGFENASKTRQLIELTLPGTAFL